MISCVCGRQEYTTGSMICIFCKGGETMSEVKQVGGDHYLAEYQHWDWVFDIAMGYLEACATKYVTRWRKKNGIQDLEKAKSYVLKLVSQCDSNRNPINRSITEIPDSLMASCNEMFFSKNNIPDEEANICSLLAIWTDREMLLDAVAYIDDLIASAQMPLCASLAQWGRATAPQAPTRPDGTLSRAQEAITVGDAVFATPRLVDDNDIHKLLLGKRGKVTGRRHVFGVGFVCEVQYCIEGQMVLKDLELADLQPHRDTVAQRPDETGHPYPYGYDGKETL